MSDDGNGAFLGVERSAAGKRWTDRLTADGIRRAEATAQSLGLADLVARVLAGRGIGRDEAERYLAPALKRDMPDPLVLKDMDLAVTRLADAVIKGEKIGIVGDYDVDGATSAAVLARFLGLFGIRPRIMIPDRIVDGYGPNPRMLEELASDGVTLLVTVDCGTMSFEAFAAGRAAGLDIVVLDHHQAGETLPATLALVNPNRQDDVSGLGGLAACGVTFLTVVALNRELRQRGFYGGRKDPDLMALLDLVALGTVADVVPLTGLNRALVVRGLDILRSRGNRGLVALADVAKVGGPPQPYHLGFVYGPRINAGGRIGNAELGVRLLTTDDDLEARAIAAELDGLNRERQMMETAALEEAGAMAERRLEAAESPVIVVASQSWHPGIVGLIASRLKDRFERPAIAIAINPSGLGTGSCRSVGGVDIGAAVRAAAEAGIVLKGGGHGMAAGLTLDLARLAELESFLAQRLKPAGGVAGAVGALVFDGALTARGATIGLVERLEAAGPYGAGNPEPLFALPAHRLAFVDWVGQGGHLALTLEAGDGTRLRAMAFRVKDRPLSAFLLANRGRHLHFAVSFGIDYYQGDKRLRARVVDVAEPRASAG